MVKKTKTRRKGNPLSPACLDCGLPYSEFQLDLLLPRAQWLEIHPAEHGLLCAQCMVRRASRLPGASVIHAVIEISPCHCSRCCGYPVGDCCQCDGEC